MKPAAFAKEFGITDVPPVTFLDGSYFIVREQELLTYRPVFSGECIGHLRDDRFIPSADFLQDIGRKAKYHIVASKEGTWHIIRGKDVLGKEIIKHNNPPEGARVVILNEHDECLGYGTVVSSFSTSGRVVKNLFDIGDLLRRERRGRK